MTLDPDKLVIEQFKVGVHSFYYDDKYICDITYDKVGKTRLWKLEFYDLNKNETLGKKRYQSYKMAKDDLVRNVILELIT